jgi:ATP-binding cassette subfamily F protein uup
MAKLGYKDQRRLEELDRLMPERQAEIAKLEAAMADTDLFAKQPAEFQNKATRLAAARAELESHELEWLALDEKRDALARG